MFGILKPDKKLVGQRLKQVKEELHLSFAEFGKRLGLKKPTISSYVQGYILAPIDVLKKVSQLSGKPVGWFYFGEIEEYIYDYLCLRGFENLVKDHPEILQKIKESFLFGDYKNIGWENEVGYPAEDFIDDCFSDIKDQLSYEYVKKIVTECVEKSGLAKRINSEQKEDMITYETAEIMSYVRVSGEKIYGKKEAIEKMANLYINKQEGKVEVNVEFNDYYLIGKLINILANDSETEKLISDLAKMMTEKHHFTTFFGGQELVKIFQSMRPELIKLYSETNYDDWYEWFEK